MTQSTPGLNPASQSTPDGALKHILNQFGKSLAVRLPATVIAYDRQTNIVTVMPSPALETNEGEKVSRAPLTMTVLTPAGGGFFLNFPLKAGDTGHIVAFDRDISMFRQALANADANTNRAHAWEDSVFIPDKFRDFEVLKDNTAEIDNTAVVLHSLDQNTKISVDQGKIYVHAKDDSGNITTVEIFKDRVKTVIRDAGGANFTATEATQSKVSSQVTGGGSSNMEITAGQIKLNAAQKIAITAPEVEINASGTIKFNTPAGVFQAVSRMPAPQFGSTPTAIGGGTCSVNFETTGRVIAPSDVSGGGVSLKGHKHTCPHGDTSAPKG